MTSSFLADPDVTQALRLFEPLLLKKAGYAFAKLSFETDALLDLCADREFLVGPNYRNAILAGSEPRSAMRSMSLKEYYSKDTACDLSMVSEAEIPTVLMSQLSLPGWIEPLRKSRLFAGKAGCVSDLHQDWLSHWLLHINLFGRKRFFLLHPEHSCRVSPVQNLAGIDFRGMSPIQKSQFLNLAQGRQIELEPGDCLLQPPLWWHHVEYLEDSCSLSIGFGDADPFIRSFFRDGRLPRDWRLSILYFRMLKSCGLDGVTRELCEAVRTAWLAVPVDPDARHRSLVRALSEIND